MSRRFGKARVSGCECTYHYTCGPCLRAAGPTKGADEMRPRNVFDAVPYSERDARTLRILLEHERKELAELARLELDTDPLFADDVAARRECVRELTTELARRGLVL